MEIYSYSLDNEIEDFFTAKMTCSSEIYRNLDARYENGTQKDPVFKDCLPNEFLSNFDDSNCV